ncbi:MAG: chemotaxis-specific protein-glutamate methyltransferase CheB [Planctomycetota bacterium]
MNPIRILVVDDSLTVRKRVVEVFGTDPGLTVVGEAEDGQRAIELCREPRPDVITMDMMLPVMSGLAATEYIMAYHPTPILIVSASINRGELHRTYDALAAGAVDVIEKPLGGETSNTWERDLIAAVKMVSKIKVITHPRARLGKSRGTPLPAPAPLRFGAPPEPNPTATLGDGANQSLPAWRAGVHPVKLLALGASTGGPAAILQVLKGLPAQFPIPILLVLHIGAPFAAALAEWLGQYAPMPVVYARDGEALPQRGRPGVWMAPADHHLIVEGGLLRLTETPERFSCRPSVDVLFESVAREFGPRAAGCLFTGMGKDGAQGLLEMRRKGSWTAAQDEASSVVFGMPREAIQLGAAQRVLGLDQFAPALLALAAE